MNKKIISLILIATFLFYFLSCTSMRYVNKEELSDESEISKLHIKTKDGQEFVIHEPIVEEQILSGYLEGIDYKEVNFSEIESMGIKKLNKGGTIILSAAGIAVAVLFIASQGSGGSSNTDCST